MDPHSPAEPDAGRTHFEDALADVRAAAKPLPALAVPLDDALGLHLAEDVVAEIPLQPFDNSAMDGYAVRSEDLADATSTDPVVLDLVGESRAGHPAERTVGPGQTIAISTGAMLPEGADAIVPVEDSRPVDGGIEILLAPSPGSFVRRRGEDVAVGAMVLHRGERLGVAALGVLAGLGLEAVSCRRRPTVSVVTTGDELVPPGEPLSPAGIHDSNSTMLAALIAAADAALRSRQVVGDELGATIAALEAGLDADVLIVCGGVSVGQHDHVKEAMAQLGVERHFWRIGLKPGGPTFFGQRGGTLVFGLPGNPASTFATFTLLVAPALLALAGGSTAGRRIPGVLGSPYRKTTSRLEAIRCGLEPTATGWRATPLPNQASHFLTSILDGDCLALLPGDAGRVFDAGERVELEIFAGPERSRNRIAS
ncbi:MAG: molybdopterin molybdotransferase MoeA [Actinobacteria bacterium]|nr:molybdopterin molybdotransferase MoeA [Actinomycetota bacterium]